MPVLSPLLAPWLLLLSSLLAAKLSLLSPLLLVLQHRSLPLSTPLGRFLRSNACPFRVVLPMVTVMVTVTFPETA